MFDIESGSDVALIDAVGAGARAESMAIAGRLAAIGALDALRERELAESIFWTTDPFEAVAAEISAAPVMPDIGQSLAIRRPIHHPAHAGTVTMNAYGIPRYQSPPVTTSPGASLSATTFAGSTGTKGISSSPNHSPTLLTFANVSVAAKSWASAS